VEKLFSTAELARMWNVSESTVKRWADSGDLACVKTPGGHRRFTFEEVSRFQRSQGFQAVGNLMTAAAEVAGGADLLLERALERRDTAALTDLFFDHALAGDAEGLRRILARSYLRGLTPIEVFERILTPSLHRVGERWMRGEITVADEHLATRTTVDALTRIQPELGRRPPNGRTAVVGCPEDEMHEVAARCVAYLLEIEGWRAVTLGMNTPFFSFKDAIERHKPDLVCVSSTIMIDLERQSREYTAFAEAARAASVSVVLGGSGFRDPAVRARFPHDHFAESFRDVLRYAATLP
jgi:excisionase family DNA binding protein